MEMEMKIKYDPQVEALIEQMKQLDGPPIHTLKPEEARVAMAALNAVDQVEEVENVEDRTIPGPESEIPIRIYRPLHSKLKNLPVLVFYHGGGWVVGDIESYDPFCRKLTNSADCLVVSVGYRLAPEHKFPAAVVDSLAAFKWIANHAEEIGGDPNRIAVGGDSAGGNLAAVVALKTKDSKEMNIKHQLLFYPTTGVGNNSQSYKDFGENDPIIPIEVISYFWNSYWRDSSDEKHPDFNVYSHEDFDGLAPVTIIAAEYDPSLDDSKLYAQKLIEAGIDVEYKVYPGMIHGFSTIDVFDKGRESVRHACASLKTAFSK